MTDITKCTDGKCPSRKTCWRYIAPSSRPQAYADFNRPDGKDKCQDYLPAEQFNKDDK